MVLFIAFLSLPSPPLPSSPISSCLFLPPFPPSLPSPLQLISRAPYLQHVVAVGCDIGDIGAKHIAHSLLNNGHLQVLDLG